MTRKTTQKDYDSVFESGRSRSREQRAKSARFAEPAASPDDAVDFVEQQVRQITNAVRLMAGQLQPVEPAAEPAAEPKPERCWKCDTNAESHLHGSKLFQYGKELY